MFSLIESWLESPWKLRLGLILFGAIYPLAFAPFNLWGLAFIALFPLVIAFIKKMSIPIFQVGFYWGIGAFSVGASWVYVSIHEFGFVPVVGAAILTFIFIIILALYKGFFTSLCFRLLSHSHSQVLVFIIPLCWLLSEYLQSVIFGGFPWLLTGYSQVDSPLGSLATWFGVYGVSWFVISIVVSVTLLIFDEKKKWIGIYAVSLLVMAGIAYLNLQTQNLKTEKTLDIALVQPNIAQEKKWQREYFPEIINILMQESEPLWGADLLIWPEGAIPAYSNQVKTLLQRLNQKADESDTHLILGIPEYEKDTEKSFVALKSFGAVQQTYHKQVLVPFGEYVPLEKWLRGAIKFLDLPMSGFSIGSKSQKPMLIDNTIIIPAICYEIVYPNLIHGLATKKMSSKEEEYSQLIVTVSNDAWFGDSFGPYQHMQMARMRALELGLPLVRATNDGITAVVDYKGQFLEKIPRYQQTSLRYQLELKQYKTIYRQFGLLGIIFIVALSLVFIIWSVLMGRTKN